MTDTTLAGMAVTVTGADGGIGRAIAEATAERLLGLGAEAVAAVETDPAAADAAPALFNAIEQQLGPVDVLVNNAAHCEAPDGARKLTHASLRRTYDVNLTAPALLTAELARRALASGVVRDGGSWSEARASGVRRW